MIPTLNQESDHQGKTEVTTCDLAAARAELKTSEGWQTGPRSTKLLMRTPVLRMLLVGLRAGAILSAHRADGPITVQVLEGRISFEALGHTHVLGPGQILALQSGLPHAVQSHEDTIFLLTVRTNSGTQS